MSWYRVSIDYGPGHQSHCISYVWNDGKKLYPGGRDDLVYMVCSEQDISADLYPVSRVRKIAKLPEDVCQKKLKECNRDIQEAQRMKRILMRGVSNGS